MTKPYAEVIGDPIGHTKSPSIHGFWLEKLGIDAQYKACHVRPGELADYFAQRRRDPSWRGCNITIPHKEKVGPLLDEIGPAGIKIGAINTVWRGAEGRLLGTNTDVEGVAEAVDGIDLADRPVVVIGAGGAARSAFGHLEGVPHGPVRVIARNPVKARVALGGFDLKAEIFPFTKESNAFMGAALVVNATQLGMVGQPAMPGFVLDHLSTMAPDGLVFDMVYAPLETELLGRAAQLGRSTSGGLRMLVGQARSAFARFFGSYPDRKYDIELHALLTS